MNNRAMIGGINRHRLVCVDSGLGCLFEFDENGVETLRLDGCDGAFDIWALPGGTFVYCRLSQAFNGLRHVDRQNNVLAEYRTESQVFGCQPIEDGGYLIGELSYSRLVETDAKGNIVNVIPITTNPQTHEHERMRMVRKTEAGSYLVNQPGDKVIRRYDEKGGVLAEYQTAGDTFAVIEDDGNLYYTEQTGIVILDRSGNEIWSMRAQELQSVSPKWPTGLQLLENGNLIVCNWLGHNCEGQGVPLFEVNRDKQVLWTLQAPDFTKNIANMQVYDNPAARVCRKPAK